ncbi:MAG: hypothetical protein SVU88_03515, partial [Candidatus Nanohaloarchaea archaeon]|nr:hypothetical protein [Candidatus Nanohaloarchaea archaeon]
MADFVQPDTSGWNFVEEQWEAPDVEDFEQAGFDDPTQAFIDVHAVHNVEDPEDAEDVSIPLARPTSDGDLESPYEAWNSAHDMISREDLSDDEIEEARSWMESVREEEFPDREPLDEGEDEEATHPDEEDEEDDDEQGMNAMERDEPAEDRGVFMVNGRDVDTVTRDDEELLRVPIQAIEPDRKGTKFTAEAQEQIVDQLQSGTVPAFPNHGRGDSGVLYDFREILGQWVDGEMEDGTTFGFLRLREGNEDAEELRDLLEQDMPVGFSVGFDDAEMNEQEDGPDEITGLDLVETSPVGIPATPSAVPQANDESALAVATYSAVRATDGVDVDEFMQALRSEVS